MANNERPAWFRGPGECHDSNGYPIYPGDLVRQFHFRGPRGRHYFLYHVVCLERCEKTDHEYLRIVPVSYLDQSQKRSGGDPMLTDDMAATLTILHGHGPGDCLDFLDRPRKRDMPKNP